MEKGLEISFQLSDDHEGIATVMALGNIVGNEMSATMEIDWKIFHVTLEEKKFFKVLFTGAKVNKLHPHVEKMIRDRFDELAHLSQSDLEKQYRDASNRQNFKIVKIKELKEEYDLWQDKFWQYF
ncbi:MAG: hypothetical protein M1476_01840 [Candidatus Thermoplasmatota archaeon]|nr:hypothetical protein [Candidatus Thermoplasmatota archaeon]